MLLELFAYCVNKCLIHWLCVSALYAAFESHQIVNLCSIIDDDGLKLWSIVLRRVTVLYSTPFHFTTFCYVEIWVKPRKKEKYLCILSSSCVQYQRMTNKHRTLDSFHALTVFSSCAIKINQSEVFLTAHSKIMSRSEWGHTAVSTRSGLLLWKFLRAQWLHHSGMMMIGTTRPLPRVEQCGEKSLSTFLAQPQRCHVW